MADPSPEDQLADIARRLDEGLGSDNDLNLSTVERVQDVIDAFNQWSDLAIRRLHEIHRLQGQECEFCAKWLDEVT